VTESVRPPKSGNLKYVIFGVLLLLGASALFSLLPSASPEPEPATKAPPPPQVERVNPMAEPQLILEEEPQAEPEEPKAEEPKKPRVKSTGPGPWDCEGDLDRAALAKIMSDSQAPVRACYEHQLKTNNMLQGTVQVKVKVNDAGKVIKTSTSGSLKSDEVLTCIRRLASEWRFPAPTGGKCAVVQVPFQFSPKN